MKKKSAEDKFGRLLMIAFSKWIIWCVVNRPSDFSITMDNLGRVLRKIKAIDWDEASEIIDDFMSKYDHIN